MSGPRVLTVNVVHRLRPGYFHETAIDKRPVEGSVAVDRLGLVGDQQVDRGHGGVDRAVYVYADEDAAWWADQLDRDVPPGLFGENLRTAGLDVTDALVGERWRIGDVLLEVTGPRTPCQNLSLRMGVEGFHRTFNRSGRVGAMTRVLETGAVSAGDAVVVDLRPEHQVSVGLLARGTSAEAMQSLLDAGVHLSSSLRAKARRVAARAG
jgi:MOSC domain-containing protein YiiM